MDSPGACWECGFVGGAEACRDLFNDVALRVRALAWTDSLKTWRLMHDVYALQHEAERGGRYKALAMHLGGLCWAIEHGGAERGYRALQRFVETEPWADAPYPPPPGIPAARGAITIGSLATQSEPALLVAGVDRWARATWVAFGPLQPLARAWVQQALALPLTKK